MTTMTTSGRSILVGPRDRRLDLYVHALAQLSDEVTLTIADQPHRHENLLLLARAYGIADRVRFEPGSNPAAGSDATPSTMADLVEGLTRDGDPPSNANRDDAMLAGERIALVTNLPAPYRIPLLNSMASRLEAVGARFRVLFLGAGSKARPWIGSGSDMAFDHEVLSSLEVPLGGRRPRLPLNLERRLGHFDPTVILCGGYSPLVAPRVARCARQHGAAFGLWGGELAWRVTASSRARRIVREWLVRRADFAVAYGSESAEYFRALRPSLPTVLGRNSSSAYAPDRNRPGHPRPIELLAVADMAVQGKGVDLLIEALQLIPELRCRLTVVGGGADAQQELVHLAAHDQRIRFLGALPQARVRECYAHSDIYLFPSRIDVFGLALIEAMGSGLAPVTSTRPGAAADLAVHERNCLTVKEHDASAWAEAIERMVTDHDLRLRLGKAARRTIAARWTIDHACEAMFAGLRLGLLQAERRRGVTSGKARPIAARERPRLVVIGPLPPPAHGVAVSTSLMLASPVLGERFALQHVDTTDRRSGANINTWDLQNVRLGLSALVRLLRLLSGARGVLYVSLPQGAPAFVRDSLFIHCAALQGWKVAGHLRGGEFDLFYERRGSLYRAWIRFTMSRVNSVGVLGTSLQGVFDGLVPRAKIAVVPNGTPDLHRNGYHRDPETVLFLSNLRARKGLREAVETALLVIDRHPTARFLFVGNWYDERLEREVRSLAEPAGGRIRFLPPVSGERKQELLHSAGVLLFPPVEPEGHPRVVLEALASGTPVVTTNRGAIAETVVHGESGFVLDEPIPEQLADRVLELLRDPALRERMGSHARSRYLAMYTQDRADERLSAWLETLIA